MFARGIPFGKREGVKDREKWREKREGKVVQSSLNAVNFQEGFVCTCRVQAARRKRTKTK